MQLSTRYASYPFGFFSLYLRRWLEMVESLVFCGLGAFILETHILCVSAGQEIFNGLDFLAFAPAMKLVLGWGLNIVFDLQKITFFIKFQFRGPGSCLCNTGHPFRGSHHTG